MKETKNQIWIQVLIGNIFKYKKIYQKRNNFGIESYNKKKGLDSKKNRNNEKDFKKRKKNKK